MMTLTVGQIADLARFAGLAVTDAAVTDAGAENEFTIAECPSEGAIGDDGEAKRYAVIAFCTDYPEEGIFGLGPELTPDT